MYDAMQRVAKKDMHVSVFGSGVKSFIGFGTIIKPNEPIGRRDQLEKTKGTTEIIKLVRHGKVSTIKGTECFWMEKRIGTTLRDFS